MNFILTRDLLWGNNLSNRCERIIYE